MKIALTLENSRAQFVLTPETETEKKITALLHDNQHNIHIEKGSFYRCEGNWSRMDRQTNDSTIIVIDDKTD